MIASIWGREAGGAPGYNVAKAGVIALAKALARDYAPHGIRVNSRRAGLDPVPRRRLGSPAEGRPRGHRRHGQARAAVRPVRHARGGRRRRRVPRVAARELDRGRVHRRRRRTVARVLGILAPPVRFTRRDEDEGTDHRGDRGGDRRRALVEAASEDAYRRAHRTRRRSPAGARRRSRRFRRRRSRSSDRQRARRRRSDRRDRAARPRRRRHAREGRRRRSRSSTGSSGRSARARPITSPAAVEARITGDDKVELVLPRGGRMLSGTITDAIGGPIAGARIDAAKLGGSRGPSDAVATTIDRRRRQVQGHRRRGPRCSSRRASADYAPQSRYVEVGPAGATADFALVPGRRDRRHRARRAHARAGRGASRRPRAATRARDAVRRERARTARSTGADGRFRITGLRARRVRAARARRRASLAAPTRRRPRRRRAGHRRRDPRRRPARSCAASSSTRRARRRPASRSPRSADGDDVEAQVRRQGRVRARRPRPRAATCSSARSDGYLPAGATQRRGRRQGRRRHARHRAARRSSIKGHVEPRQVCDVRARRRRHELGARDADASRR